ncbi:uncharacterized protein E0L32_002678 [Thyridium curvatum]|uniref:ubiquitinyl hydrolase 1 n=1 Tax=Thyridium curvatum TaxID=1093900 RepID=A0A507BL01_9PEZI|nr:uncharacterized protein E0L32_002678 [Thyridium curvatum]TPX18169.1 hypothetical protein E0L32_002678 [Thyridium curvatum]
MAVMHPSHSGISGQPDVPQNRGAQLAESEHHYFGRLGRLTPKWIEDLLAGPLKQDAPKELDIGCAAEAPEPVASNGRVEMIRDRHELLIIGHQCESGVMGTGSNPVHIQKLSCTCRHCRYHFVFRITHSGGPGLCGSRNFKDFFHHLVYTGSELASSELLEPNDKYYPLVGAVTYQCSSKTCSFAVRLEISQPRLPARFIDFLRDDARVLARRQKAVREDPDRFKDLQEMSPDPLMYLWIYLRDIVEPKTDTVKHERKVDKRNKKFYIQFGNDADTIELFRFLEFEEFTTPEAEVWKVPSPEMLRPAPIGSRLAFFQDLKSEIETLQYHTDREDMKPHLAIDHLKQALGIDDAIAETKVNPKNYDPNDFDTLGIIPALHESIFWYAFTCQLQTCPQYEPTLFTALQNLSQGRGNEELDVKIASYASVRDAPPPLFEDDEIRRATEMSLKDAQTRTNKALDAAYDYFGLTPPVPDDIVIGKYLAFSDSSPMQKGAHIDKLVKIARETHNDRLLEHAQGALDYQGALQYLGFDRDTDPEFIASTAPVLAQEGDKDYLMVATAMRVIGDTRHSIILQHAAAALMSDKAGMSVAGTTSQFGQDGLAPPVEVNMSLPVGLQNIRNTCYLNSILQYLFTVKSVREIVLNRERYFLDITPENVAQRRIDPGSAAIDVGQAFAGQQFVTELCTLFTALQGSSEVFVKPRQQLALAALKTSKQLEDDGAIQLVKASEHTGANEGDKDLPRPPPLPARPSPTPPIPPARSDGPQVTVNAIADPDRIESSSSVSSQTLVDQIDEVQDPGYVSISRQDSRGSMGEKPRTEIIEDVDMDGSPPSAVGDDMQGVVTSPSQQGMMEGAIAAPSSKIEASVQDKIIKALNDSSVTGTDQQDVEEVMGNIIGHLRAAIKPTGVDRDTDSQTDPIMDTFFWKIVDYTKMGSQQNYSRNVASTRWVTAFPSPTKTITLLDALDVNFGMEYFGEGDKNQRFASIAQLPPILHICIQRSTSSTHKNTNPIVIPEVLSLDRYMDASWDSDLMARRKRSWNLHERLKTISAPKPGPQEQSPAQPDGATQAPSDEIDEVTALEYDTMMVSNPEDDSDLEGFTIIDAPTRALGIDCSVQDEQQEEDVTMGVPFENITEAIDRGLMTGPPTDQNSDDAEVRAELDNLFVDMTDHKYLLHAVICHMGKTRSSGHYWVWIYDFEKGLWRKYNDSNVYEETDSRAVMEELSTKGEPYYLAYVRADNVSEMVNIPSRAASSGPAVRATS